MNIEVIAMTIIELRKRTGLSQSKFANRFHLNVRTVQQWEQEARKAPDYVVWLIERVMDLEEQLDAQRN
ncbi:MAG: helix-turn-helix domain-containing protein [Lachnospiraceae bacterium]|nr:helix-turn-helix domain-containing protein [Lachnospiraceae bacterium]